MKEKQSAAMTRRDALIRRGYGDGDIEGILGGNFKRVLSEIWTAQESGEKNEKARADRVIIPYAQNGTFGQPPIIRGFEYKAQKQRREVKL
jgi:hypothetical protein